MNDPHTQFFDQQHADWWERLRASLTRANMYRLVELTTDSEDVRVAAHRLDGEAMQEVREEAADA